MGLLYMKKLDNFANCLDILKQADFELADSNDIYRMGVVGQSLVLWAYSFPLF